MQTKRVLITGGTGYMGWWMQQTKPKGIDVFCLNHDDYNSAWDAFEWDYIVHLAPIDPVLVLHHARKVHSRVLFASSGAIYNALPSHKGYGQNKLIWEQECLESGVDCVIARLFTFVGEYLKNKYAITSFIEAAKAGKPLEVWGNGSSIRTYLYGWDLGNWLWRLLLEGEGIYDVGGSIQYTILQVAQLVAEIIPSEIHILNNEHKETYYIPTLDPAFELGCKETIGLKEAIERVIQNER